MVIDVFRRKESIFFLNLLKENARVVPIACIFPTASMGPVSFAHACTQLILQACTDTNLVLKGKKSKTYFFFTVVGDQKHYFL